MVVVVIHVTRQCAPRVAQSADALDERCSNDQTAVGSHVSTSHLRCNDQTYVGNHVTLAHRHQEQITKKKMVLLPSREVLLPPVRCSRYLWMTRLRSGTTCHLATDSKNEITRKTASYARTQDTLLLQSLLFFCYQAEARSEGSTSADIALLLLTRGKI